MTEKNASSPDHVSANRFLAIHPAGEPPSSIGVTVASRPSAPAARSRGVATVMATRPGGDGGPVFGHGELGELDNDLLRNYARAGGEPIGEHIRRKYGATPEASAASSVGGIAPSTKPVSVLSCALSA